VSASIVRLLTVSAAVGSLAACAHGPIPGRFARPNEAASPAILNYESSFFGGSGKLWVTLPDGETFRGPYRLAPHDPKRQMTASLTGDRGSTMHCRFTLREPGVGPDRGGTVECRLSTGGVFEATF
jgi:hypothetical protein